MSNNVLDLVENVQTSEFYPTPPALVQKMLEGIDWDIIETILEPSAGKGDILKEIAVKENMGSYRRFDVDCIELDPNLRQILKYNFSEERRIELGENRYRPKTFFENGIHIVHDDFLTYQSYKRYDLIILNPPFSEGDKHLYKALQMQERYGGTVICLLNAQTVKNPHTRLRVEVAQMLQKYNAQIDYIENAFAGAERRTGVEIALIKVNIERRQDESEIYNKMKAAERVDEFEQQDCTELEISDYIKAMVSMYKVEVRSGLELIRQYKTLSPYILESFDKDRTYNDPILKLSLDNGRDLSENNYLQKVRSKYWGALLSNRKFIGKLTTSLQERYRSEVERLKDYEFSEFNILTLVTEMNTFIKSGIEEEALKMFRKLTIEYTCGEFSQNVHYYNGWTTNKACKIEKKVILPCYGVFLNWCYNTNNLDAQVARSRLEDIERVLNYFDGAMSREVSSWDIIQNSFKSNITKNIKLKYFTVTFYKKGTVHITFNCPELIKRFNIFAAQSKNELPPSYGKKKYSEMTPTEKAVIDDFQGKDDYAKVLERADYYLAPITKVNALMIGNSEQMQKEA